jgi:hypothetical protein
LATGTWQYLLASTRSSHHWWLSMYRAAQRLATNDCHASAGNWLSCELAGWLTIAKLLRAAARERHECQTATIDGDRGEHGAVHSSEKHARPIAETGTTNKVTQELPILHTWDKLQQHSLRQHGLRHDDNRRGWRRVVNPSQD